VGALQAVRIECVDGGVERGSDPPSVDQFCCPRQQLALMFGVEIVDDAGKHVLPVERDRLAPQREYVQAVGFVDSDDVSERLHDQGESVDVAARVGEKAQRAPCGAIWRT
jgi:hypothetical protein